MSFAGVNFSGESGEELGEVDMVDGDADSVRFAPFGGVDIEPDVVVGDKVTPLKQLDFGAVLGSDADAEGGQDAEHN